MNKNALVIFKETFDPHELSRFKSVVLYDVVIAPRKVEKMVCGLGTTFQPLEDFIVPGSIYEASALVEEFSLLTFSDGTRITKSVIYKGYELWWMHYMSLYLSFCLPYTQHKKLLAYLKDFGHVWLVEPPREDLYVLYLQAYGCAVTPMRSFSMRHILPPLGISIQILLTVLFLPFLVLQRPSLLLFTGDKFDRSRDYDARMHFIYEEVRKRRLHFVEFVRSLESWKTVLVHAFQRKRPAVYPLAIAHIGKLLSIFTAAHWRRKESLNALISAMNVTPEERFKFLYATHYLKDVDADIWAIKISAWMLRILGIKAAFMTAATERNYHTVLGCKLNRIPTVGILHGVASRHYNMYDFLPTYDGGQSLTVDRYGVWSVWWKAYYEKNNKAYTPNQLIVSGPMRPSLQRQATPPSSPITSELHKVLFVSEQLAVPEEVLPYLRKLLDTTGMEVYVTFRPYRDGFELWLKEHHPDVLEKIGEEHIIRVGIKDAIMHCDMVIGTHSTAVLEALLQCKPIAFFRTHKWGDYFDLKGFHDRHIFYAENIDELITCIYNSRLVPKEVLENLRERFFGDPYQNGSAWVVDELMTHVQAASSTASGQR